MPLAIAAMLAVAAACTRSEPARLEVRALTTVAEADAIEARFQLKTVGGQLLTLDGIVPACGCMPASPLTGA